MINLPILHSLDVTGYALYPGKGTSPGLHVQFSPGLTLVLGTNGLGKSTLVTMIYRLMTGPYDIPALQVGTDLGTANLRTRAVPDQARRTFGHRVADDAATANGLLAFDVGGKRVSVERNLRNLSVREFRIGDSQPSSDEIHYQSEMARLANVSSFGDWILLLRYIQFYFEDRRSLVWDPSAQRQLLRILFLEPEKAQEWTSGERQILEADTRVRNTRVVANAQRRALTSDEALAKNEPATRDRLEELEREQQAASEALLEKDSQLNEIEDRYQRSRLRFLQLEQRRESAYRELEQAQVLAINARLPSHSESARYIYAQLITENDCLVCGSNVPSFAQSLETHIRRNECIVCGSDLGPDFIEVTNEIADEQVNLKEESLQAIESERETARHSLADSENERNEIVAEIQALQSAIAQVSSRIDRLWQQLPPQESNLRERRLELASLQATIESIQKELTEGRAEFDQIIKMANATVVAKASEIQQFFLEYAHEFLLEDCHLVWSPRAARLGQAGRRFDFPAFDLELGGSDFNGTIRRSGPDAVSESQREFIDLSFRIALAKAAAIGQVTTLVMDAPESSLDAVFETRAARVLGRFGRREAGNRLVVTSNLIAGNLIPELLREAADVGDRISRVVDLLTVAAPTAALNRFRKEYHLARDRMLSQADAPQPE